MPLESLLEYVPPEAVYHRAAVEEDSNALGPWQQAVERFVRNDDEKDLWGELVYGSADGADGTALRISPADVELVRGLLRQNAAALEFLEQGIARGRLQFPEFHGLESIPNDSEFICRLGELARLPFIRFKLLLAEGDLAAAAENLALLARTGQLVCNGEGQMLHYLIGLWIRGAALRGIARLAGRRDLPPAILERLLAIVDGELQPPDGMGQSLRVDFCTISLPQLERTLDSGDMEAIVEQILDLYFVPRGDAKAAEVEILEMGDDDHWLQWRREQMLRVLEGHPRPFDKAATARMMGRVVAQTIREVESIGREGFLGLRRKMLRLRRQFLRRWLERRCRFWPVELTPGFPYESGGRGEPEMPISTGAAGVAAFREVLTETRMAGAREKIRGIANPLGLMLVEHLLAFDYSPFMFQHRAKLKIVRRLLTARG